MSRSTELLSRYVDEVVLALDLCPWAAPALERGAVRIDIISREISAHSELSVVTREVLERLAETPRTTELVLLGFPRATVGRLEFDGLLRSLRSAAIPEGGELDFALAAFHPSAHPDQRSPETLIPFLRRSPMPLVQAVRSSVLRRIEPMERAGTAFVDPTTLLDRLDERPTLSLRERIARANAATVARVGLDVVEHLLDELREEAIDSLEALAPLDGGRARWR